MTPFLRAEWHQLVMVNFVVEPELLSSLVPNGTELDSWQGRTYVSVVGFLFLETRLWGVPVPFHSRFEEINLRFYVRRRHSEGDRRGVVFIREFVSKPAVAGVARWLYGEPYTACPTQHRTVEGQGEADLVEYQWRLGRAWHAVRAGSLAPAKTPAPGSEEEFIAEHYWGYTALDRDRCREYEVRHEPWRVRRAASGGLECDVGAVYGSAFVGALSREPTSIFVAEGSAVTVHRGQEL
jgi:hypothetical protein